MKVTVKTEQTVDISINEFAKQFAELDAEEQAQFFNKLPNALYVACEQNPSRVHSQVLAIRSRLFIESLHLYHVLGHL